MTNPIPTYPIQPRPGPVVTRLDYDDIANDDPILILHMKAFARFSAMIPDDKLSYYQVAGIHASPYIGWDGDLGIGPITNDQNEGYCVHGEITFPTFHRVYMLLFEQRLWEVMNEIINDPNEAEYKTIWTTARNAWRLPFWNWARFKSNTTKYGMPEAFKSMTWPTVGGQSIVNPLWKFANPVTDAEGSSVPMDQTHMGVYGLINDTFQWTNCSGTSRCDLVNVTDPANITDLTGANNWQQVDIFLNEQNHWYGGDIGYIGDLVSRMMSYQFAKYGEFASTKYEPGTSAQGAHSVEYIHNNLHNFIGGGYSNSGYGGHMQDVSVAAFDPVFWAHHCFIDGLFAMWQSLNPNMWFDQLTDSDPKPTDPLHPFHINQKSTHYCSNDVRYISQLNYNYPNLPFNWLPSKEERANLIKHVNETYGATRAAILKPDPNEPVDGKENDYVINVIYDKYALGEPYNILFFLSEDTPAHNAEKTVEQLLSEKGYLGVVCTFGGKTTHCGKCKEKSVRKELSKAQVPITVPLLVQARDPHHPLRSLLPHAPNGEELGVTPHLKDHLVWRVLKTAGGERKLTNDDDMGLVITVLRGTAKHDKDATVLSTYESYKPMFEVTTGKPGGAIEAHHANLWA